MWLLRLPPAIYFIVAPFLLGFGVYFYFDIERGEVEKTEARSHKAPAAVALESYNPAKNKGDFNEVVVIAQLDLNSMIQITKSRKGVERSRLSFGRLYPTTAKDINTPAPALLVAEGQFDSHKIATMVVGNGPIGPLVKLDGLEDGAAGHAIDIAQAAKDGPPVVDKPIYIQPFVEGRDAALAQKNDGMFALLGGFILALAAGGYGYGRKQFLAKRRQEQDR
jgi:hypothetical protein